SRPTRTDCNHEGAGRQGRGCPSDAGMGWPVLRNGAFRARRASLRADLERRKSPLELTKHATTGCQSIKGLFAGAASFSVVQPLCGGSGHIVQITTSLIEHANSHVPSVLASLTKGGLDAATRSLAIEYAKRGIRANAVA